MNGIHETLDYEEMTEVCSLNQDNYICPPDVLRVRHRPEKESCSYQLVLSKLTRTESNLRNCFTTKLPEMTSQQYLMKKNEVVISSPIEDWLQYHCVDRTKNDKRFLKIGVNKMPTYEGCHYETSELQMRNPAQNTLTISDPGSERGLKIIQDLDSLDSLLESQLPKNLNLTNLQNDLKKYSSHLELADRTVDKITKEVDNLDSIRTMSDFSPTSLDLTRPFHTSNWVAFIFWIMVIMAIALTWSIIRNFQWYKKLVEPGCCKLWSLLKAVLSLDLCRKKKPIERAFSSFWDIGEPPAARDTRQDSKQEQMELLSPLLLQKNVPTPDESSLFEGRTIGEPWKTVQAVYGNWQMRAVLHDHEQRTCPIYYNPRSRVVSTQDGRTLRNVTIPSKEDIEAFYTIVKGSKHPPVIMEGSVIRHKMYPNLYYNTRLKGWINEETQSSVPGLNSPLGHPLYIPTIEDSTQNQSN
jgi:hypothetical protein